MCPAGPPPALPPAPCTRGPALCMGGPVPCMGGLGQRCARAALCTSGPSLCMGWARAVHWWATCPASHLPCPPHACQLTALPDGALNNASAGVWKYKSPELTCFHNSLITVPRGFSKSVLEWSQPCCHCDLQDSKQGQSWKEINFFTAGSYHVSNSWRETWSTSSLLPTMPETRCAKKTVGNAENSDDDHIHAYGINNDVHDEGMCALASTHMCV